jgi:hypothetical protein
LHLCPLVTLCLSLDFDSPQPDDQNVEKRPHHGSCNDQNQA